MAHLKERLPTAPTKLALGVGMAVALLLGGCGDASSTRGATEWSSDEPRLDDDRSPGASGTAGIDAADGGPEVPGPVFTLPNAVPPPDQPQLQNLIRPPAPNPVELSIDRAAEIQIHKPAGNAAPLSVIGAGRIEIQNQAGNAASLSVNHIASMQIQGSNQGAKLEYAPQVLANSIPGPSGKYSGSAGVANSYSQNVLQQPPTSQQQIVRQSIMNSTGSSNAKGGMLPGMGHLSSGADNDNQDAGAGSFGQNGHSQGIAKDGANDASGQAQVHALSGKQVPGQMVLENNVVVQQLAPSGVPQQQTSLQAQQPVANQTLKSQAQQLQRQKTIRAKSSNDLSEYLEENKSESSVPNAGADKIMTYINYQKNKTSNYQSNSGSPGEAPLNLVYSSGQGQIQGFYGGQQTSSDRSESSYSYSDSLNSSEHQNSSSNLMHDHHKYDESGGFRSSNFHTAYGGGALTYTNGANGKKVRDSLMFELDGVESEQAASREFDSRNFNGRAFSGYGGGQSTFKRGDFDESDECSPQPYRNSSQQYEKQPRKPVLDQFSQQESMGDDDSELSDQQEAPKAHGIVLPLEPKYAFPTITLKVCTAPDGMPGSVCTKELRLLVDPSSVGIRVFNSAIASLGLEHALTVRNGDKGLASLATCSRVRGAALWGPVVQAHVKVGDHWTPQKIALQQIGQGNLGQAPKACRVTPRALQTFALRQNIDGIIGIGPYRHEPEQGDDGTASYYSCHGNSCTQAPGTVEQQRLTNLAGALVPPDNHVAASVLHMPGMGNGENQPGMLSLSVTAELRKTLKDTDLSVDFAPNHSVEQQLEAELLQYYAGDRKSSWEGDYGIDLSRLSGRSLSIFFEDDDPAGEHGLFPAAYYIQ